MKNQMRKFLFLTTCPYTKKKTQLNGYIGVGQNIYAQEKSQRTPPKKKKTLLIKPKKSMSNIILEINKTKQEIIKY